MTRHAQANTASSRSLPCQLSTLRVLYVLFGLDLVSQSPGRYLQNDIVCGKASVYPVNSAPSLLPNPFMLRIRARRKVLRRYVACPPVNFGKKLLAQAFKIML